MSRVKSQKEGQKLSLKFTSQDNTTAKITFDGTDFHFSKPVVLDTSVLTLPNGTAAAPSLTFADSTTIGIYRSGSNVLGFSTAGSERVTIDAQGDLNVGTNISIGNGGTGSIVGAKLPISEAATAVLTAADSGKVFFVNGDTTAAAYTLPTAAAGLHFKWVWTADCNQAVTIVTSDVTDGTGEMLLGGLLISSAAAVNNFLEAGANVNTLTFDDNVADKAAGIGTWVEIIATEAKSWVVTGVVNSTADNDSTGAHFTNAN